MFYLYAFILSIPSPIISIINAEAVALFVGIAGTRPWLMVGFTMAAGQCVTFSLLYFFGEAICRHFKWLKKKVDALHTDTIRMAKYQKYTAWWLVLAALFGLPPLSVLAVLAPSFHVKFRLFFAIAYGGRFLRFCLLAGMPSLFTGWVPIPDMPDWLDTL